MDAHMRAVLLWLAGSAFAWWALAQFLHTDLLKRAGEKKGVKVVRKSQALSGGSKKGHFLYWGGAFLATLLGWMIVDSWYIPSRGGILNYPVNWCRYYTGWPPDLSPQKDQYTGESWDRRQQMFDEENK